MSEPGNPDVWRCFYCDEVFTERAAAAIHFGTGGALRQDQPACRIDIAEYREMEEIVRRYADEDSDLHRAMYRMQSEHAVALRRAEEAGYARGLRDAVLHPKDAGSAQVESPSDQDLTDLAGRLLHASVSIANAKPQPADGNPRWEVGVMEEAVAALRGVTRPAPVLTGWTFHRAGEEAFACGPDGGGWFTRSGSLWQRTLFDLTQMLADQENASAAATATNPISTTEIPA